MTSINSTITRLAQILEVADDFGLFEPSEDIDGEAQKPSISRQDDDGRGWFRTSDLSRVKRALSH